MVIWRIPRRDGPRFVGPGHPSHPGYLAGRLNQVRQVASQLAADRPKKARQGTRGSSMKPAGQPNPAGHQATQAPGRHPGHPASQPEAQT